jgi:hypothetical protein
MADFESILRDASASSFSFSSSGILQVMVTMVYGGFLRVSASVSGTGRFLGRAGGFGKENLSVAGIDQEAEVENHGWTRMGEGTERTQGTKRTDSSAVVRGGLGRAYSAWLELA